MIWLPVLLTVTRNIGYHSNLSVHEKMKRLDQIVLITTFIGFSWLAMQAAHELGHVLGAVATSGHVTKVVLHPCDLSRTDVQPNPHPLLVVWAGPLAGALLPLLAYLLAHALRLPGLYLFRFFAGFCLIANGVYIGVGSIQIIADAADMLYHGSPRWLLIVFALLTAPLGLYLWNGLGPNFGLGRAKGHVTRPAAITSLALFALLAGLELIIATK